MEVRVGWVETASGLMMSRNVASVALDRVHQLAGL